MKSEGKRNQHTLSRKPLSLILGAIGLGVVGLFVIVFFALPSICISCAEWLNLIPPAAVSQKAVVIQQEALGGINLGQRPPDFSLTDVDGKSFNLRDFEGKPTIMYFSASTCSPCIPETEGLAQLKDRYSDLNVIWISVDPFGDSASSLREYRRKYARESFIYALDTPNNDVAQQYRINALGTLFLLNQNQVIAFKGVQPVGSSGFEQAVKQVVP